MQNYHTNERPNHIHQRKPYFQRPLTPRPPETILAEQKLIVERKSFHISRRENERGQFIVISEERVPGPNDQPGLPRKSNRVIIPADGRADFIQALLKICGDQP